jgi:hypothetical protein
MHPYFGIFPGHEIDSFTSVLNQQTLSVKSGYTEVGKAGLIHSNLKKTLVSGKNTNAGRTSSLYMGEGSNPFIRGPVCGQYVVGSIPPLEMS